MWYVIDRGHIEMRPLWENWLFSYYRSQICSENDEHSVSHWFFVVFVLDIGNSTFWNEFVHHYIDYWTNIILEWVIKWDPPTPILVVMYEDLVNNTVDELTRMLNYLDHHIDSEYIEAAIHSIRFKRRHTMKFQHFTVDQINILNQVIEKMEQALLKAGKTHILSVLHYLQNNDHLIWHDHFTMQMPVHQMIAVNWL